MAPVGRIPETRRLCAPVLRHYARTGRRNLVLRGRRLAGRWFKEGCRDLDLAEVSPLPTAARRLAAEPQWVAFGTLRPAPKVLRVATLLIDVPGDHARTQIASDCPTLFPDLFVDDLKGLVRRQLHVPLSLHSVSWRQHTGQNDQDSSAMAPHTMVCWIALSPNLPAHYCARTHQACS